MFRQNIWTSFLMILRGDDKCSYWFSALFFPSNFSRDMSMSCWHFIWATKFIAKFHFRRFRLLHCLPLWVMDQDKVSICMASTHLYHGNLLADCLYRATGREYRAAIGSAKIPLTLLICLPWLLTTIHYANLCFIFSLVDGWDEMVEKSKVIPRLRLSAGFRFLLSTLIFQYYRDWEYEEEGGRITFWWYADRRRAFLAFHSRCLPQYRAPGRFDWARLSYAKTLKAAP